MGEVGCCFIDEESGDKDTECVYAKLTENDHTGLAVGSVDGGGIGVFETHM